MVIFETKRLILKHLNRDDLDDVYAQVYADPDVKSPWSGATGTPEELKDWKSQITS